jgi:hypothetical protein
MSEIGSKLQVLLTREGNSAIRVSSARTRYITLQADIIDALKRLGFDLESRKLARRIEIDAHLVRYQLPNGITGEQLRDLLTLLPESNKNAEFREKLEALVDSNSRPDADRPVEVGVLFVLRRLEAKQGNGGVDSKLSAFPSSVRLKRDAK